MWLPRPWLLSVLIALALALPATAHAVWTAPLTLSPAGRNAFNPDVGIDQSGNTVFVWVRRDGTTGCGGAPGCNRIQVVARSAGGNDFTIVGSSPVKSPALGQLNTYNDVRIPVHAGDVIGLYNNSVGGLLSRDTAGYAYHLLLAADPSPSDTDTYIAPAPVSPGPQLDVSAVLEADCDGDKFGDETQDADTSSCNPPAPTPPTTTTASAATGQRAAAKKHCKKKPKGPKRAKCLKKAKKLPV